MTQSTWMKRKEVRTSHLSSTQYTPPRLFPGTVHASSSLSGHNTRLLISFSTQYKPPIYSFNTQYTPSHLLPMQYTPSHLLSQAVHVIRLFPKQYTSPRLLPHEVQAFSSPSLPPCLPLRGLGGGAQESLCATKQSKT
ncbi:hypothetical protein E2C01_076070 [Portunus trituberculatus]|uniref:Uncharacterized protein n=1 Tax=Portunus trituberculatus TaxID=210409 RepID=A0A5B7IGJ8_PORTR|nr:hypothetical protein [Portunus trituberculatus]